MSDLISEMLDGIAAFLDELDGDAIPEVNEGQRAELSSSGVNWGWLPMGASRKLPPKIISLVVSMKPPTGCER